MKLLFDTSVLVAAMIPQHDAHERAFSWFQRIVKNTDEGAVSAHTIAELYAELSTLPYRPVRKPPDVRELIDRNIINHMEIVSLDARDYVEIVHHMADRSLIGGSIYDALILWSAEKAGAARIVTLNSKDFLRILPEFANRIIVP